MFGRDEVHGGRHAGGIVCVRSVGEVDKMAPNSKLNHVAMSVPAQVLDAATRAEIVAFYSAVFGWSEQLLDEPGNPLVIRVGVEPTQFVFVQPVTDEPTQAGNMDHFGVEVRSEEAVDEILTAAR